MSNSIINKNNKVTNKQPDTAVEYTYTDQSVTDQSVTDQSVTDQSVTDQSATEQKTQFVQKIYDCAEEPSQWPWLMMALGMATLKEHAPVLKEIGPHFRNALQMEQQLSLSQLQAQLEKIILDSFLLPLAVVTEDAEYLYGNTKIQEHGVAKFCQVSDGKMIFFEDCFEEGLFSEHLKNSRQTMRCYTLHDPGSDDECSYLAIVPILESKVEAQNKTQFALIFSDCNQATGLPLPSVFQNLFKLSEVQAQVLHSHLGSSNMGQVAEALNRSEGTVQEHIKTVYRKTGINKKAHYVATLSGSHLLRGFHSGAALSINSDVEENNTYYISSSGKRIAYKVYGPEDGEPLVFFHSFMGSALEVPEDLSVLHRCRVRLIVPERPGVGYSDFRVQQDCFDWVSHELLELLDYLEIEQAMVMARSSGTLYALAFAQQFPERVSGLGISGAISDVTDLTAVGTQNSITRTFFLFAAEHPELVSYLFAMLSRLSAQELIDAMFLNDNLPYHFPEIDLEYVTSKGFYQNVDRAKRQGSLFINEEIRLLTRTWPIDFAKIPTKTLIWFGDLDNVTSVEWNLKLRNSLNTVHFEKIPNETNGVFYRYLDDMVEALRSHHPVDA
jgi:pimeloyl-ACP methyl ester carboxylesterase/DNA-binding CsgD family transcriptional regulator